MYVPFTLAGAWPELTCISCEWRQCFDHLASLSSGLYSVQQLSQDVGQA